MCFPLIWHGSMVIIEDLKSFINYLKSKSYNDFENYNKEIMIKYYKSKKYYNIMNFEIHAFNLFYQEAFFLGLPTDFFFIGEIS